MREHEPGQFDDATQPTIEESPFDGSLETTGQKVAPAGKDDATIPTGTDPLPIGFGDVEEEQTAALGATDPPTDIEIHAPAMRCEPAPERQRVSPTLLLAAVAVLLLILSGCLVAAISL